MAVEDSWSCNTFKSTVGGAAPGPSVQRGSKKRDSKKSDVQIIGSSKKKAAVIISLDDEWQSNFASQLTTNASSESSNHINQLRLQHAT